MIVWRVFAFTAAVAAAAISWKDTPNAYPRVAMALLAVHQGAWLAAEVTS